MNLLNCIVINVLLQTIFQEPLDNLSTIMCKLKGGKSNSDFLCRIRGFHTMFTRRHTHTHTHTHARLRPLSHPVEASRMCEDDIYSGPLYLSFSFKIEKCLKIEIVKNNIPVNNIYLSTYKKMQHINLIILLKKK